MKCYSSGKQETITQTIKDEITKGNMKEEIIGESKIYYNDKKAHVYCNNKSDMPKVFGGAKYECVEGCREGYHALAKRIYVQITDEEEKTEWL